MKSKIVKIGNSRGVRIPKPLLEQLGLGEEVQIQVENNRLVISPVERIRAGWGAAFQEMSARGDDALFDPDAPLPTQWEKDDWEWQ